MPRRPSLPVLGASLAALTLVVGTVLRQTGTRGLGTASPPFIFDPDPQAHAVWLLAAIVACAVVAAGGRELVRRPWLLVPAALSLALALNAIRFGSAGWDRVFELGPGGSGEAKNEYLPSLPALGYGVGFFLDRFAELVPTLAPNAGAHPPGVLLTLHLLGIDGATGMAALCIACAVGCVPATWWLARAAGLTDEDGRLAAVLALASPGLLLLGTTSADAIFALLGTLTAALLLAPRTRPIGCVALVVSAFFTWALLAVGAYSVVLVWRRDGLRPAAVLAAGCAIAVVAGNAALYAAAGYDALGVLRATHELYTGSVRTERPLWFWVVGSPTAWLVMLGAGAAYGWLTAVERLRPEAVALAAVIVVASVAGFSAAETERIWLPFAPLACVAAAPVVGLRHLRLAVALGVAQALAIAALTETVW